MTSVIDEPGHDERPRPGHGLPPIGIWWPMLERPLQRRCSRTLRRRCSASCGASSSSASSRTGRSRAARCGSGRTSALHRGMDLRRRLGLTARRTASSALHGAAHSLSWGHDRGASDRRYGRETVEFSRAIAFFDAVYAFAVTLSW